MSSTDLVKKSDINDKSKYLKKKLVHQVKDLDEYMLEDISEVVGKPENKIASEIVKGDFTVKPQKHDINKVVMEHKRKAQN